MIRSTRGGRFLRFLPSENADYKRGSTGFILLRVTGFPYRRVPIKKGKKQFMMREFAHDAAHPAVIAALLHDHHLQPKKSAGQNFFSDAGLLEKMANAAQITPEDAVLEIGPGLGALTQRLSVRARRVVCVELDGDLLSPLETTLAEADNVTIVHRDFLKALMTSGARRRSSPTRGWSRLARGRTWWARPCGSRTPSTRWFASSARRRSCGAPRGCRFRPGAAPSPAAS